MANFNDIKGLKLVSINTNSLNLSSRQSLSNFLNLYAQKIEGILNLNADIICLQDVRLGSDGKKILQKSLDFNKYNRYKLYANSSSNKRGVTILFKYTVQHEVLDMKMCPDENYLLLKVKIRNCEFIIGSIYSDIYYRDPNFLNRLKQDITSLNCENVLIAGDFNAVTNPTKISDNNLLNMDAVNVKQIPNLQNSAILNEWIENSFLIDIFRQLYPERKVYSHILFNKRDFSRT